jgi:arabinogalactan oligomer/maltooligosaccharide transport system substrate-binding protein
LWHAYTGSHADVVQAMIERYNATNPDCVRLTASAVDDPVRAIENTDEGPDIVAWQNTEIGHAAEAGLIAPLDDFVESNDLSDVFVAPAAAAMTWDGRWWGLPETMSGIALVYNKAMVTEDMLPQPDDFEELLATATQFQRQNWGVQYLCNPGLGAPDAYHVAPIYFGFGVPGFVDEAGNAQLNSEEALAAGEWIRAFSAVAPAEASPEICQTMMTEGQIAIWWTGPEAIAPLIDAGVYHDIAPMGRPYVEIRAWSLTADAVRRGHAEAAVAAMSWWTSEGVLVERVLQTGEIPANAAALADRRVQNLYAVRGFGAALERGIPLPTAPVQQGVWQLVGEATTSIWTGVQRPEDALNAAQEAAEILLSERR